MSPVLRALCKSILIQDVEQVRVTARRLKVPRVKLSIDDFGTGYSSLSYLKRFAVDKLKIDQSLIRDRADDPNDAAIVQAIVHMARGPSSRRRFAKDGCGCRSWRFHLPC